MKKISLIIIVLASLIITITACSQGKEDSSENFLKPFNGTIEHLHGIGYMGNNQMIAFAAHDGLKVYNDGKWFETTKHNNDYMGFNAIDTGFITSGHPGENSTLPNPIGIQKSEDNGRTLDSLAFQGESDFHGMGVGYQNHIIYVLNEQANSKIEAGIYKSTDDAKTWSKINGNGLGENIFSIAVHPTKDNMVAMAGQEGIFLSEDGGESFKLLTENVQGTSAYMNENFLFFGTYGSKPALQILDLNTKKIKNINLPTMKQDAVMYFAQNPSNPKEYVFVTFNNDGYLSEDAGNTWTKIIKGGQVQ